MKLLIICPTTSRGGVEEYGLNIAKATTKNQWEVNIALPETQGTQSLIADFGQAGISYYPLNIAETSIPSLLETVTKHQSLISILKNLIIPRLLFDFNQITHGLKTLLLLLKIKPQVVQIILPWPNHGLGIILASALLKIPTVIVFQLVPYSINISSTKLKLYQWAKKRNQSWLGVSQNNCQLISTSFHIPLEEINCIYNGAKIQAEFVADTEQLRHQVRTELGLSENSKIALTVARLSSQKGHDYLIPVIPHLIKQFPNLRFVWVGDGEQREVLENLVTEYGVAEQVLFLGYRSDIPRLLQASDLFVFPTYYEGQPFAILEAMAYGLPVIASATSGIPEVIENQVHGLLTRTGDSCDLLEAIRWALHNPQAMEIMAANAQLRIQDFSEEKMLKETLDLLENLIIS